MCTRPLAPCSIFLVDHAWTFQSDCARKQLEVIDGLAARMATLMGLIDDVKKSEEGSYDADSESGEIDGVIVVGVISVLLLLLLLMFVLLLLVVLLVCCCCYCYAAVASNSQNRNKKNIIHILSGSQYNISLPLLIIRAQCPYLECVLIARSSTACMV